MAKKTFKRIRRVGKLSPQEAARDREIRRKIMEEFPPLEAEPDSPILSDPLRDAITHSGKSVRQLAKQAKVSEIVLQQFLDGQRDLRLATAERLAQILGLKLVAI
jgi:ribosome-binding protein aMBF1 (putative translation factor)